MTLMMFNGSAFVSIVYICFYSRLSFMLICFVIIKSLLSISLFLAFFISHHSPITTTFFYRRIFGRLDVMNYIRFVDRLLFLRLEDQEIGSRRGWLWSFLRWVVTLLLIWRLLIRLLSFLFRSSFHFRFFIIMFN